MKKSVMHQRSAVRLPPPSGTKKRFWVLVASKDHVMHGVWLGIAQAGQGKRSGISRMHTGDMVIYYSPKVRYEGDEVLHAFTAIGEIADEEVFPVEETPDFKPFRRKVQYTMTGEIGIALLIPDLTFIRNKRSWGYLFRSGIFEIGKDDFDRISAKFPRHE